MRHRLTQPELMDRPGSDERLLHNTLTQFGTINRWLARARKVLKKQVVGNMKKAPHAHYHIVDLGAGACETMAWLLAHCQKQKLQLRVTACDHDPQVVAYARARYGNVKGLDIQLRDVMDIDDLRPVDFFFANHFLHHLNDAGIIKLLKYLESFENARVLISDLRRSRLAYTAFYAGGPLLFPRSFAWHDGLLSIRKGFKLHELQALVKAAAGANSRLYQIKRNFPARLVIVRQ